MPHLSDEVQSGRGRMWRRPTTRRENVALTPTFVFMIFPIYATGTHPSERHYGRGDATLESVPRSLSIPGNIQAYYLEYEGRPTKRFLGQRPELLKPRLLSHGAREGYAPRRELGGICYEGGVFQAALSSWEMSISARQGEGDSAIYRGWRRG